MSHSAALFENAKKYIVGGVNSPVRAFNGVEGTPIFFARGEGAYLTDEDNNRYVDYVGSWGPLILGHQNPEVIKAIHGAVDKALSFGAPTRIETELAQKICECIPSIDKVRMVNSGTEATMTAIRLARAYTQKDILVKFEGGYHGHSDSLLVKAGSGALTLGHPSSPGIPDDVAKFTLNLEYNNLNSVKEAFKKYKDRIAAIIVEPVAGNMGCVPPVPGFLAGLREICDEENAVLIFDEVITGFRLQLDGAQGFYNVTPDLTTLGKIIGGGMPVGAIGGKDEIMAHLAPLGAVYQAGTLSGNPVAMQAGLTTLQILSKPGFYQELSKKTETLVQGLKEIADHLKVPMCFNVLPGMFGFFFTKEQNVQSFTQVMQCDVERFKSFYHNMLKEGIYFGPSAFESAFVSSKHDDETHNKTFSAFEKTLKTL